MGRGNSSREEGNQKQNDALRLIKRKDADLIVSSVRPVHRPSQKGLDSSSIARAI
jgi:hypothetical protein